MDPLLGSIMMFGFNFAPRGWALCNGQLLSISQNTALFSLLGTTYGGNGQTTFALPDLRSRIPLGMGQGTGLSVYTIGQASGAENVTLTIQQMPGHTHQMTASSDAQSTAVAAGNSLGSGGRSGGTNAYASGATNPVIMASVTGVAGNNQPFSNVQPYLTLNFCIALQGIFPTRD